MSKRSTPDLKKWLGSVLFAGAVFISHAAGAVAVSCPGTASTADREFTLNTTPGSSCELFGNGPLDPNATFNAYLSANSYVLLDKSDDAGSGALPGSLTFTPPTSGLSGTFSIGSVLGYTSLLLAMQSGVGILDPDWAVFLLGATSGSWSISGNQALSHANLYGVEETTPIPLPAALPLFAGGLGLLGWWRRRKRSEVTC